MEVAREICTYRSRRVTNQAAWRLNAVYFSQVLLHHHQGDCQGSRGRLTIDAERAHIRQRGTETRLTHDSLHTGIAGGSTDGRSVTVEGDIRQRGRNAPNERAQSDITVPHSTHLTSIARRVAGVMRGTWLSLFLAHLLIFHSFSGDCAAVSILSLCALRRDFLIVFVLWFLAAL